MDETKFVPITQVINTMNIIFYGVQAGYIILNVYVFTYV